MEAIQARDGCVAGSEPMLARSLGPLVKTGLRDDAMGIEVASLDHSFGGSNACSG
jgi:hypothetical protein